MTERPESQVSEQSKRDKSGTATRLGRVTVRSIMQAYKTTPEKSVRRAAALPSNTRLFEVRLTKQSALAGRTLREAHLPPDTLVVAIIREGEPVFPRASTRPESGDTVLIMADPASKAALHNFLGDSLPQR